MDRLLQDLRYGVRVLIAQPAVSLIAILALAISIGANTAIFSVVNGVVLKPLPFSNADRVVMIWNKGVPAAGGDRTPLALSDVLDWRSACTSCDQVAAVGNGYVNYTGKEVPEQIRVATVTANFFSTLGAEPLLGRTFLPDEERPGSQRVAVVSERFWQQTLGSSPGTVDSPITLSGVSYTIVGVMPRAFDFPSRDVDIWLAMPLEQPTRRGPYFLSGMALLRQGVTAEAARLEMSETKSSINGESFNFNVLPVNDFVVGDVRPALLLLLIAVTLVVLIAATNVTNLLLSRATAREREISIRSALGASRSRIVRQLLTESVLLSAISGAVGLLLASWGVQLLLSIAPHTLPRAESVSLDGKALAWTALVSISCGLIFGTAPAFQSSRLNLSEALKEGGRTGTEAPAKGRLRNLLIISEVSLAMLLMIGAGLVIKSFWLLERVDAGINPERVLTAEIRLPRSRYPNGQRISAFYTALLDRIESMPGVESAAVSGSLPPDALQFSDNFYIEGRPHDGIEKQVADIILVSPGYFQTLGLPLKSGRFFTKSDTAGGPLVALINETLAHRYFEGEDPVGNQIVQGTANPSMRVVGVVRDAKYEGLDAETQPAIYVPAVQNPSGSMFLLVRTHIGDPTAIAGALRDAVDSLDPELPLSELATADELLARSVAHHRFRTTLIGVLAIVALLLASVGIYGVVSYSISRRTHEIGIRMALGARRSNIISLMLRQFFSTVLVGIALGLVAAVSLTHMLANLLFGVSATDLSIFIGVPTILTAVALGACLVPLRRATRVDPLVALRYE